MDNKTVSFDETEASIVVYALEKYIEDLQKMASDEHSGVARFLIDSNISSATTALGKIQGVTV